MTDPRSSPKGSSKQDHAYFRALEDEFIRLRGAPLLLSPSDWQVAKSWRRQGVPLELARRVMERIFERQKDAESKSGIRSLRYFGTAVERAWRRIVELGGEEGEVGEVAPIDVSARLGRLAGALPARSELQRRMDEEPDGPAAVLLVALEGLPERLKGLTGNPQSVEVELARIDAALLERLRSGLNPISRSAIEKEAEAAVRHLADTMPADRRREAAKRVADRVLRASLGLPVLSLFSPEARAAVGTEA